MLTLLDGSPVPRIGLGTWKYGGDTRADRSRDESDLHILRQALEMGYRHFDTAEMYGSGHSEELIGQAIRGYERSKLFITTKVRPPNLGYESTLRSLDGSLKRLGVEVIDLYLIHWPSSSTPLARTFKALNQAVREGKVRMVGVSNFDLEELKEAQRLSETPIATNQVPYSLVTRRYLDNGVIPYCREQGIVVTAYSPVEEGRLASYPQLEAAARAHNATAYQIALAWLVNQPLTITIPMSKNPQHLRENLEAGEIRLSEEDRGL
jgi:diketogulonate reductase-like aldo/keto reductase